MPTTTVPCAYRVWTHSDLRWVDEDGRWPALHTLVRVETLRPPAAAPAEQATVQQRYYISSRALTPAQADACVRGH
jgi:hypothetical protein